MNSANWPKTLITFVHVLLNNVVFFFSFSLFSCGSKVKTDEESNNSGRGKKAHSKVWGHREPSPHLQMVQRWQRAEEKQNSQNKEQPVSTNDPCPVKPTRAAQDEKSTLQSRSMVVIISRQETTVWKPMKNQHEHKNWMKTFI